MKTSEQLEKMLINMNRKSYSLYKELRGRYQFSTFILNIEHVQGDPFASPSRLSVEVMEKNAGFPKDLYDTKQKRIALRDLLTRIFAKEISKYSFRAKGSGKSGVLNISRCGQEILERTTLVIEDGRWKVRFEAGFPANGRTINSGELKKILFEYLPKIVDNSLYYKNLRADDLYRAVHLAEDQQVIREELGKRNLVAFVANGSVLPRENGVSPKPMKNAVVFHSPQSMEVEMFLPHRGSIKGMGIPKGITLIVGGGYHGKSTLLKALEQGIYNHIEGDGREYVITEASAVKIRAEDGRSISHINISPFINDLPNHKDTKDFSTEDASGSTSQAANVVEALTAGSKTLLIDEDTCATNFMVRDELMQSIITRDKEPITPFISQAEKLYKEQDVSVILVAGSSGVYFHMADKVLQMDQYQALDITEKVKTVLRETGAQTTHERPKTGIEELFDKNRQPRMLMAHKMERKHDQVKLKVFHTEEFSIGRENVDLKYVEQLVDPEQTMALAWCLKYILEKTENKKMDIDKVVEELMQQIERNGLKSITFGGYLASDMAQIRVQDVYACLNRYRRFI